MDGGEWRGKQEDEIKRLKKKVRELKKEVQRLEILHDTDTFLLGQRDNDIAELGLEIEGWKNSY